MTKSTDEIARELARELEKESNLWELEFSEDYELYEMMIWAD